MPKNFHCSEKLVEQAISEGENLVLHERCNGKTLYSRFGSRWGSLLWPEVVPCDCECHKNA